MNFYRLHEDRTITYIFPTFITINLYLRTFCDICLDTSGRRYLSTESEASNQVSATLCVILLVIYYISLSHK